MLRDEETRFEASALLRSYGPGFVTMSDAFLHHIRAGHSRVQAVLPWVTSTRRRLRAELLSDGFVPMTFTPYLSNAVIYLNLTDVSATPTVASL